MNLFTPAQRRHLKAKSFNHVRNRLLARYGILIDEKQYGQLVRKVQAMTSVVKLRTTRSGCVLYAIQFGELWIPVLYDPVVRLVTTVYPKAVVEFHRRRIIIIDTLLTRLRKQSCVTPSSREDIAGAIAAIKAQERKVNEIRKARA
jgi:hypothetical protein